MKEKLKALYNKEPVKRAVRTFVQTACSTFAVNLAAVNIIDTDAKTLKAAITSLIAASIAAGVAAVMNLKKEDEING